MWEFVFEQFQKAKLFGRKGPLLLEISVLLSRILNIIISSWQRKAPICHWKICPYMKQMTAEVWSQTRPAVWLPWGSSLVEEPDFHPRTHLPQLLCFLHLISAHNPSFCVLKVWQLRSQDLKENLQKCNSIPSMLKKKLFTESCVFTTGKGL